MFTEMCFRFVIYDAYKKELKAREEAAAKDTKKSAPAAESEPARKVSLKDWILNLLDQFRLFVGWVQIMVTTINITSDREW